VIRNLASYFSKLTIMERLADPVTSSLLALLFVGVASTSPLRALPLTFTENEGKSAYRWSSNQTAIIAPQAFDSEVGNVEVHLFTTDGKNIKVVQKTRRGAVEPDAISITVPYSFDDDDNMDLCNCTLQMMPAEKRHHCHLRLISCFAYFLTRSGSILVRMKLQPRILVLELSVRCRCLC
jgi:hypothetical protein